MNKSVPIIIAACLASLFNGPVIDPVFAEGSSPFNMMNPSRWFGGKSRDYDDNHDAGYNPYGQPGYGMPYGPPGYAPPYGPPPGFGYGAPQAPQAYAPAQAPAPAAQQQTDDASATRIRELEERIRQLEANRQLTPQPGTPSWQGSSNMPAHQAPSAPSTWQGGTNMPAPQPPSAPSTWQGGANMPSLQPPPAQPSWQETKDYAPPANQALMPPAWQRSAGSNPQAATESPAAPSWQGTGIAPQMPASPALEPQGTVPEQKHRFRPF